MGKRNRFIIAGDPGPKNFGVAVYQLRSSGSSWELLGTQQLQHPVNLLVGDKYHSQTKRFLREWESYLDEPKAKGQFVLERFQSRLHRNNASELVNIMLGLLTGVARGKHWSVNLIIAATWKGQLRRSFDEDYLNEVYKAAGVSKHRVDAALIGRYQIDKFASFRPTRRWYRALERAPFV